MSWWWPFKKKPKFVKHVPSMNDKALCLGLNTYLGAPLRGCVNDAGTAAEIMVQKFKFPAENVHILCDQRATTSAIRDRLHWLAADAHSGSRLFLHFSGHGAQTATRTPYGEVDGLDEIICPIDFDWTDAHMIRDKEFYEIFSKLPPGVKFNWISDSCHSGDQTRGLYTPKTMPTPFDIMWKIRIAKQKNLIGTREDKILDVGYVSGCKSNQTSADTFIDGKPCGALTHTSSRTWRLCPRTLR
jgi:metacaspase-1